MPDLAVPLGDGDIVNRALFDQSIAELWFHLPRYPRLQFKNTNIRAARPPARCPRGQFAHPPPHAVELRRPEARGPGIFRGMTESNPAEPADKPADLSASAKENLELLTRIDNLEHAKVSGIQLLIERISALLG